MLHAEYKRVYEYEIRNRQSETWNRKKLRKYIYVLQLLIKIYPKQPIFLEDRLYSYIYALIILWVYTGAQK